MSSSSCPNSRSHSSMAVNHPSWHVKGSDPVLEKVVPDDFRVLAGTRRDDTKSARKVEGAHDTLLVSSVVCKHKQIDGCFATELSVCAESCKQVVTSQLQCCTNCGRATSSETDPYGQRVIRAMARLVCIWRRLASSLRSSSAASSGSS